MRLTLTKRGEYGVRMLIHLASLPEGQRTTASELAEICDIPAGNVPTIVNVLSRAGILASTPGRHGGCMLARAPEDISCLDVIRSLEGGLEIQHCLLDSRRCHDKDPECAVHHAWSEGRNAAIEALARTSLRDVLDREAEIAEMTAPRPPASPAQDQPTSKAKAKAKAKPKSKA